MCAPDSFRSPHCLLRGCPDDGHAHDQMKFPDRNALIQSDCKIQPDIECGSASSRVAVRLSLSPSEASDCLVLAEGFVWIRIQVMIV